MQLSIRLTCAVALLTAAGCGSTPVTLTVTATPETAKADGKTPIRINITAAKGERAAEGDVTVKCDIPGSQFDSEISDPLNPPQEAAETDASLSFGEASVRLYSASPGSGKVTVFFQDSLSLKTDTKTISVTFGGSSAPTVATFVLVEENPRKVALAGNATIGFIAKDAQDQVVPNATITFALDGSLPGVTISPKTAVTDSSGLASTTLTAGSTAGTIAVKASSGTVSKLSETISITGAGIDSSHFSIVCPHYSIGGFETPGISMECRVFGADKNGAFIPGSQVNFLTEAGAVPQTVPFEEDPQDGGVAAFNYRAVCPYPQDVPALCASARDTETPCTFYNKCKTPQGDEARKCNPRDGWARLVAYTSGALAAGESLPEPFVDTNDNGTLDTFEREKKDPSTGNPLWWIDANGNGQWDSKQTPGPDGNILIWRDIRILWTGGPDVDNRGPGVTVVPDNGQSIEHCGFLEFTATILDINGNIPTTADSGDSLEVNCTGNCTVADGYAPLFKDACAQPDNCYSVAGSSFKFRIKDVHECTCEVTSCLPDQYTMGLKLYRTLAAGASSAAGLELREGVGPHALPRTGTAK